MLALSVGWFDFEDPSHQLPCLAPQKDLGVSQHAVRLNSRLLLFKHAWPARSLLPRCIPVAQSILIRSRSPRCLHGDEALRIVSCSVLYTAKMNSQPSLPNPNDNNAYLIYIPSLIFVILLPLLVLLRFWVRLRRHGKLGADDWAAAAAMVSQVILFHRFHCV